MIELSGRQRDLLAILRANHARGVIFARTARLPAAYQLPLLGLRSLGLVARDSFRPIFAPSAAVPKRAPRSRGWSDQRKVDFLAALHRGLSVRGALEAVGLHPTTKKPLASARRHDPECDRRCTELQARNAAARLRRVPGKPVAKPSQAITEAEAKRPQPEAPRTSPAARDTRDEERLTPFERTLRAVERGAPVTRTFRPPTRSYDHVTLAGIGTSMLG